MKKTANSSNNTILKVVACILITAFLFSTMEVVLKLAASGLDSLQLTFLRFLIGGIVLLPFGIVERRSFNSNSDSTLHKVSSADLLWVFLVGIMGIPISMLCFQLGVERCNAATAAAIMSLNPLTTMVFSHFLTPNKMTKLKYIAFFIGIVAGIFLIRPWDIQKGNTPLGMLLMIIAASTFSLYSIMGKRTIEKVGTFTQISLSFIMGSLVLLIIMLIMERPIMDGVFSNWLLVLYIGIFVTGVGYLSLNIAIKLSDATTGSIAFFIKPAIAPIFAILLLNESILWNTVLGVIFLIIASVITLYDTRKNQSAQSPQSNRSINK